MPVFGNKPQLQRKGLIIDAGEVIAVDRNGIPPAQFQNNKQADITLAQSAYPTFMTVRGGFTKIATGAGLNIAVGECGWYPLIRLRSGENIERSVALFGLTIEQTAADTTGVGGGLGGVTTPQAWGNIKGEGAGIVAGEDLPTLTGTWKSAPCSVPGVSASGTGLIAESQTSKEIMGLQWAPGSYSDPVPFKRVLSFQFSPYVIRMRPGSRFDVALVIDRQFLAANKNILGSCVVQAHFGLPFMLDQFRG